MNLMNSPCTRRIISFNVSELLSNKFSFQWQNAIADVSVIVQPHHEEHQHGASEGRTPTWRPIQSSICLVETFVYMSIIYHIKINTQIKK